ncbi:MAG TPA: enoyl-CoA hydratase/isomerase family protein [Puia sp.]|jgi:methylglutaconyl-CoA hydratase|nr:enoyl-CoA hydratase/isomerase family protein [Puia sp.]
MLEQIQGYVKSERHGSTMIIEFFHPQSNSLPKNLLTDLASHIHGAGLDDEIRVVVIRSAGDRAFCAGASFNELLQIKTNKDGEDFFNGFAHVINSMRKCPKLIIARIQGKCVGGGVGIAAAADYAIALTGAEIKLSELEIGIGPFVVGPAVERKIGISAFSQLTIDAASWRTAEWAKTRGLYSEVHMNMQELDESVQRLVNHLIRSNPQAVKEIKKIFWQGTSHWDQLLLERAKISGQLVISEQAQKAIRLFNKA